VNQFKVDTGNIRILGHSERWWSLVLNSRLPQRSLILNSVDVMASLCLWPYVQSMFEQGLYLSGLVFFLYALDPVPAFIASAATIGVFIDTLLTAYYYAVKADDVI
jgi:hypothetical protein